ncbi:GNAT family N-acetyltransferase [Amycolatopsis sp. FDAARGOS 1241]|uniref:GNAT family N-acetyltransferase n=1 Tax=Amycolatopsis sp. FDAARGOS 1241 TaxID=2778070 RepID=UPI00194F5AAD|nr:GNAT family N-acetyltransferase [Amycolatopsis sp. FDAARGOS 1241]QRP49351.1 GNAT family N-acetyltransferase [Amycolatopsis sp. FDAARGOS 1241]
MDQLRLRAAEPHEAAAITELARRSKAYWGYSREFLDRVREDLTVHAHQIRAGNVVVAEDGTTLLGYYRLGGAPPDGELADLFVDPGAIGTGLGRRLWDHAVGQARERGFRSLELEADPNAEPFYLHVGATKTGERQVASGRTLPVLRVDLR